MHFFIFFNFFDLDINECVEGFNLCEDLCLNTIGSFYCECQTLGFKLAKDNSKCEGLFSFLNLLCQ